MPTSNTILENILLSLDDNQAINTQVIDVKDQTTITDYMIITTGRSSRHTKAVAQKLMETLKSKNYPAVNCSGLETGEWVLIDFSECIVHVMQADTRDYYNLEGLWNNDSNN